MKESKLIKFFKTKEFLVVLCSFLCTLAVWGGICIAKNVQNRRLQQQSIGSSNFEDADSEEYADSRGNKAPVLKLKTKTASLLVKETATISVTVEGTEEKPTFTSSDNKVATVNEEGVVQGVASGKAEITIQLGSLSEVCKVTVEDSARVVALINALPKADKLTGLSGVAITEAREAYDALSDRAKASVKNYKTLTNLEKAYEKEYRMLYSMTDIASFTKNSNYPGYKNVTLASGKDATYGKILSAFYSNEILGDSHVIISYKKAENIEWLLEGYGIVTFYVYNSRPDDAKLICNFGGDMTTNYITLSARAWTRVEVPSEDFISGSYFGIYDIGYRQGAQEFRFSPIWAERGPSPEELAQVVIDMINALPKKDQLNALSGSAIEEARVAYDALKEEAQALVKNYATLKELESEYHKEYKMIYGMANIEVFKVNDNFPGFQYTKLTSGTDATYGKVLNATYTSETAGDGHVVVKYTKPDDLAEQLKGYKKVCFYVYNGRTDDRQLLCDFGGSLTTSYQTLNAGEWTKVEVPTADFISGSYFGVSEVGYQTGAQEFKFSPIWAERGPSPEVLAQAVIDMIAALPKADQLNALSGTAIVEARIAYDELDEEAKAKVSNYATLRALEGVYGESYKMLYGMSDISAFTINDNYPGFQYTKLTSGTDATYGKVLNATYTSESAGDGHVVIKYAKPDDLANQLSGYKKVYFYVYNGRTDNRQLLCDFGGSLKTNYQTLYAGAWTMIEVSVEDFISGSYFGIIEVGYQTGAQEFMFSAIWAEKGPSPEVLAQAVIDMIAALPKADQLNALSGSAIVEARAAYDELDEEAKAKVSNYATLTELEAAYGQKYKMMYSMLDISAFSADGNYPGFQYVTLISGTDATYGKVLNAIYSSERAGDGHAVIKYAKQADLATQLSGYDKVCFYVYNGRSDARTLLCDFGGSLKTEYVRLNPGEWTKVEVPVADFISGSIFGILEVGYKTGTQEFKISAIWAEKGPTPEELAQGVIDMIAALPASEQLNAFSGSAIVDARTAYDALSDEAKAKVSNYATLTELEAAYGQQYKMLYGMSDISPFAINNDFPGFQHFTLTSGTDATYGNVLNATYANEATGEYHIVIKYAKSADFAAQLSGYEKVCFYVYNGRSDARTLLCDFGGGLKVEYVTLKAGGWTKVEVPVADFISGSNFGIYSVGYKTGTQEFKFSAIWAEKGSSSEQLAQTVIDMIAALPKSDQLNAFSGSAIVDARTAYDALSDDAKEKVTNYNVLTALESAYATNYKMLYDMSDISGFTKITSWGGFNYFHLSQDTDDEYGNLLNATFTTSTQVDAQHILINYPSTSSAVLNGYDNVCFYVYNDSPRNINLLGDFGGSLKTEYITLVAGEWTKVQVPASEFASGSYFGILDPGYVTGTQQFKFSAIWAEKNTHNTLYDMSDISAFAKNEDYAGTQYYELSSGTDVTYGNVLNATYASETTGDYHLVIKYAKPADLATQLSGYEKVCFYVYNGRTDNRQLMCNFGGSLSISYKTLTAGEWTKVEVPVADFISGSYFGIYSVGYKTGTQEFKFSSMWVE